MRLSRAEAIAIIRNFAKIPNDPKESPGAWDALLTWAVLADDALMSAQRAIVDLNTRLTERGL